MHRVRVTGVLIEDGRLLLVRQRVTPERGWSLPGGGVEAWETLEEALLREMEEETGLRVSVRRLLYVADLPEDDLLHVTFELGREGGEVAEATFVEVAKLGEYGFSDTWRELVAGGFPDAPAYIGHKRNLGL
jgi:ADP-ribose pyrophosphatase YjhB (NUDIX family)